jgi:hypothetical protein
LTQLIVTGTNQGHDIGYQSTGSFADGSSRIASTIYFQTDKQSSIPNTTPNFTMAAGVDKPPRVTSRCSPLLRLGRSKQLKFMFVEITNDILTRPKQ